MATDTIPARSNGQFIDENWFNLLRTVLGVDLVPRNASGVATAVAGSVGSSTYPWSKFYLGAVLSGLSIEENSGAISFKVGGVEKAKISSNGLEGSFLRNLSVATAAINDLAVTAGKLAADAVTTDKILNANVTVAKLVAQAQLVTSENTGYSTTNTAAQNVTNLSGSFTSNGRSVLIMLQANEASGSSTSIANSSYIYATVETCFLRFVIDGGTQAQFPVPVGTLPASAYFCFATPSAGSHSYGVQVYSDTGAGEVGLDNCRLKVIEVL